MAAGLVSHNPFALLRWPTENAVNLYADISEKAFTAQVIQLARWLGWKCAHFRPAMTKRGRWVTAVQGDGAGFFDLVLVRAPRVMFVELKSEKGKLSKEQNIWLSQTKSCGGVETYVWYPRDIANIETILR